MMAAVETFIVENIDLIEQDTKESWQKIDERLYLYEISPAGEPIRVRFYETMIEAGIDPVITLGYVPNEYLKKSNISHYKIPEGTVVIGNSAFRKTNLNNIYIPDGVRSIESLAFENCHSLSFVSIPNTVTNFGKAIFWHCEKLTSIEYRGTVQEATSHFNSKHDQSRFVLGSTVKTIHCSDGKIEL